MTQARGPRAGEARGDGRRPPAVEQITVVPPRAPGLLMFVVLRGRERANAARPTWWTLGVRADGAIVQTRVNGLPARAEAVSGLVVDLGRSAARAAMGDLRRGWWPL